MVEKNQNNKKILSMRKEYKLLSKFWAMLFIADFYILFLEFSNWNNKTATRIFLIATLVLMAIFGVRYLYFKFNFKSEKDDELSKENKLKTASAVNSIFIFLGAILYFYTKCKDSFSVEITSKRLGMLLTCVFLLYTTLKYGIFVLIDRNGSSTEEM